MEKKIHIDRIYSGPPRPLGERVDSAAPMPEVASNLGAQEVIAPPGADGSVFFGPLYGTPIGQIHRLCAVDRSYMRSPAPGSWVINISASYADDITPPAYLPLIARVWFGSGGAQQYIEVDAWNSKVAIPGENAVVEVFWDSMGPVAPAVPTFAVAPVTVKVSIERSVLANPSLAAIRSFYWLAGIAAGPNFFALIPVPKFATAFNYLSFFKPTSPSLALSRMALINGLTSIDEVPSTIIEAMNNANQFRAVSPAAGQLYLESSGAVYEGRAQFMINS